MNQRNSFVIAEHYKTCIQLSISDEYKAYPICDVMWTLMSLRGFPIWRTVHVFPAKYLQNQADLKRLQEPLLIILMFESLFKIIHVIIQCENILVLLA